LFNLVVDYWVRLTIFNLVVERNSPLDEVFQALAHPARRGMLRSLADGERSVGDLAAPFAMTLAGASKHVKVLERAGLVRRRVAGRTHYCRLEADRLAAAHAWLRYYERFWTQKLDSLEALLDAEDERASKTQREGDDP
jgi:DNA-binding transcriptional ArsR family regulator